MKRYKSRKFILSLVALLMGAAFSYFGMLSSTLVQLLIGIVASYGVANVGNKACDILKKNREKSNGQEKS